MKLQVIFLFVTAFVLMFASALPQPGEEEEVPIALVGSLAMGSTFMVSPLAGVLTDTIGIRLTTFLGGSLASGGLLLASIFANNIRALYATYGIMFGVGAAFAYTPSLAILGHYFTRRLGVANGIVTCGSSLFTIIMPFVIDTLLKWYGIVVTLRVLALLASGIIGASLLFKPTQQQAAASAGRKPTNLVNREIFRNRRFLLWCTIIPLSLFGYFVPYVHMMKFVQMNYPQNVNAMAPVICIGLSSGIGRLIFGYLSDIGCVNRVLLQQMAFLVIGVATSCLPSTENNYPLLLALSLVMGLFDGCFIAVLGPIAFDLCGRRGATQAIGLLLGLCAIPLTLGPYVAGVLFDRSGSYDVALRLAGIPPILGAIGLFLMRCIRKTPVDDAMDEKMAAAAAHHHESDFFMINGNGKHVVNEDVYDEDNNVTTI